MVSISDNDQKIIEFLVRNFSGRFTTREIGIKLKISPAGSYKSLKKLEQGKIVAAEKLGTGLFFHINYQSNAAFHLACFAVSQKQEDIKDLKEHARAVLKSENEVVIVSHHHDEGLVKGIAAKLFQQAKIIIVSEEEFARKIMTKDSFIVDAIKASEFIHGTEYVVSAISKMIR